MYSVHWESGREQDFWLNIIILKQLNWFLTIYVYLFHSSSDHSTEYFFFCFFAAAAVLLDLILRFVTFQCGLARFILHIIRRRRCWFFFVGRVFKNERNIIIIDRPRNKFSFYSIPLYLSHSFLPLHESLRCMLVGPHKFQVHNNSRYVTVTVASLKWAAAAAAVEWIGCWCRYNNFHFSRAFPVSITLYVCAMRCDVIFMWCMRDRI